LCPGSDISSFTASIRSFLISDAWKYCSRGQNYNILCPAQFYIQLIVDFLGFAC
jgi:hypothetical protein